MRWLAALLLAGCTPVERIVEVKVPVEVARVPPPELLNCTASITPPAFAPAPDGALLPAEQIPVLQAFVSALYGCHAGWSAWATHEGEP